MSQPLNFHVYYKWFRQSYDNRIKHYRLQGESGEISGPGVRAFEQAFDENVKAELAALISRIDSGELDGEADVVELEASEEAGL